MHSVTDRKWQTDTEAPTHCGDTKYIIHSLTFWNLFLALALTSTQLRWSKTAILTIRTYTVIVIICSILNE